MIYVFEEKPWVIYTSKQGIDAINKALEEEFKKMLNAQEEKKVKRRNRKK